MPAGNRRKLMIILLPSATCQQSYSLSDQFAMELTLTVMRVLALFLTLALTFLFSALFLLVLAVDVRTGVAGRVLYLAHDLLRFALDLLSGAFNLGFGVARPLADLALRTSCGIVDCTFYAVLIHDSTSVVFCFGLTTSFTNFGYFSGPA
jgi:hypothetical protein